jgi:excinuclease ABC subunit C
VTEPSAERIAAKLAELPDSPGVYQLKDRRGRIIYIGKALNLKNRVPTYFQPGAHHDPRISHLVRHVRDLDWIVVHSELDALMLESSLIRQFKPHYNTMLKDDKSYPYVKITVNEPFPRVMLTRRYVQDKAKYWGPMTSVAEVRSAVKFIAGLFQLRTCTLELDGAKYFPKPCLDYHLKICSGPCAEYIEKEEYRKLVAYAVDFFNGNYARVHDELRARMAESAEQRQYENAARYRDLITAAEKAAARQRVIGKPGENLDVIGLARSQDRACVLLLPVRDGRLAGDRKYILNHPMEESEDGEVLAGFIKLHYANPLNVPPEVALAAPPAEEELLKAWLGRLRGIALAGEENGVGEGEAAKDKGKKGRGGVSGAGEAGGHRGPPHQDGDEPQEPRAALPAPPEDIEQGRAPMRKVEFTYPQRGHKRDLLDLALRNAAERLHTELLSSSGDYVVTPGQRALKEHLGLDRFPRWVEGFDIANLQGLQATGAMVVFTGGRKNQGEYRLFNIRLKQTPDDYAMLQETLTRRLKRLLADPAWLRDVDVVLIDGGKGQLHAVQEVFDELLAAPDYSSEQRERLERIKLCSLAKQEELVYHYNDDGELTELRLPHTDEGLRLLVGVRNEAHRYGNLQHQRLRDKAMRLSVLDTIPGLGEARKAALLKHFGSGKKLREADVEQLQAVEGIGEHLARHIRRYLDRDAQLETAKAEIKREMRVKLVKRHKGPDDGGEG